MNPNNEPYVAIMMPSLNHENFVEQAIESVYSQGYRNLRLVVCDDASTDGNYAKLQQLAARHQFILLRNESRQGIIKTLNRCFAECRDADYYYALASDDVLQPGMIRACLKEFKNWPQAGMLLGSHRVIDKDGLPLGRSRQISYAKIINLDSVWEVYYPSYQFQRGSFTRSTYPMEITGHAEDRHLFISCLLSQFKVIQTPIPFVLRRIHGKNASLSDDARLCAYDGWSHFAGHPLCAAKRRKALQRQMLICLSLPNSEKEKFTSLFAKEGISLYYLLFRLSFARPIQLAFSFVRGLEKKLSSVMRLKK
jgi:glycosyltransferase involved in cell wall biosynthesis